MELNLNLIFRLNIYGFMIKEKAKGEAVIRKVIVPAAGLGTRLFPATKEQPKEMLPIFTNTPQGDLVVKPVVQMVFEQLYDAGLREFCYVVGRGKRGIEDHFTPDAALHQNTGKPREKRTGF